MKFATQEWFEAVTAALKADPAMKAVGGGWVGGAVAFVFEADSEAGWQEDGAVVVDVNQGKVKPVYGLVPATQDNLKLVPNRMSGKWSVMKTMFTEGTDPVKLVADGKVSWRGDLTSLARNRHVFTRIFSRIAEVETVWQEEQTAVGATA